MKKQRNARGKVGVAKGFGPRHGENAAEGEPVDLTKVPSDTVPAVLTPREAVLNRNAAELAGRGNIEKLNAEGNVLARKGVDLAAKGQASVPPVKVPVPKVVATSNVLKYVLPGEIRREAGAQIPKKLERGASDMKNKQMKSKPKLASGSPYAQGYERMQMGGPVPGGIPTPYGRPVPGPRGAPEPFGRPELPNQSTYSTSGGARLGQDDLAAKMAGAFAKLPGFGGSPPPQAVPSWYGVGGGQGVEPQAGAGGGPAQTPVPAYAPQPFTPGAPPQGTKPGSYAGGGAAQMPQFAPNAFAPGAPPQRSGGGFYPQRQGPFGTRVYAEGTGDVAGIGVPNPQKAYDPREQVDYKSPNLEGFIAALHKEGQRQGLSQGQMAQIAQQIGGGFGGGGGSPGGGSLPYDQLGGQYASFTGGTPGGYQGGISDIGYPPFLMPNAEYHADKGSTWEGAYDPEYLVQRYAGGTGDVPFR